MSTNLYIENDIAKYISIYFYYNNSARFAIQMYIQMMYNSITSILYRIKALIISDVYIGNTNKYRLVPIYTGSICYLWHIYLSISYQNIGYLYVNSK